MRGPHDVAVDETAEATGVASYDATGRPPGGKALLRLIELLGSRAEVGAVDIALEKAAVPEATKTALLERTETLFAAQSSTESDNTETKKVAADIKASTEESAEVIPEIVIPTGPPTGPPTGVGPQWRSLGPTTIPNGQTYGSSRVNVSGRVAAIAVDPHSPAHVLCGAANGGVWESFDRGASWAPRTDYAATTAVGAIVFDPTNPTTVYCGTGEGNWWSSLGQGILRSTNGGTTWGTLCTAPFVGQGFYDLQVVPTSPTHLLAGTNYGLYTSTDSGVTWTRRRSVATWSISIGTPATRGANPEMLAACSDGVYQSTDGGVSWNAVTLTGSPGSFNRIAVSICPADRTVAYAWGANGASAYLWRRAGGTWTAVTPPSGVSTGQAWYDWYVAAAPDSNAQVFCGAIESYRGTLSGTTWTWLCISNKGSTGSSIHPDQHAIAFEPGNSNMIYVGCDGGLFRSPDRGVTWQHCNNGLVITEFEYLAQNVGSSRWLIGGTQDNGTDRWTGSSSFDHSDDGDGGYCCVNHDTPTTVFHTYYNMSPVRSTSSGDFGSFGGITPTIPAGETSLFYPPMRCTDSSGSAIAIGGGALYVSSNNGTSWTRLAFPSAATASAICMPDSSHCYVATTDGRVFVTTLSGTTWGSLSALTTPRSASASDIYVSAGNLQRIWVTYSSAGGGYVYRSDNGGTSWTDYSAGLPNQSVNAIEVDSRNASRIWVAGNVGVYQSLDAGAHWASFSNGLPNAFIGDLAFHPHAWVLRAATRNRGIWEIPVDGWMTVPVCGVQFTGTLAANQTMSWFTFNWPATWHVVWTVMPTSTTTTGAQITLTTSVQRASAEFATYWLKVQNLTGAPVTFQGRYAILSRY